MLFFASLLVLFGSMTTRERDPRVALGRASLWWAATATVWIECLSAARAVEPLEVASLWIVTLVWAAWLVRHGAELSTLIQRAGKAAADQRLLSFVLLLFVICAFVTAFVAAPNNWDSLTYHLTKVEHWLQNRSLGHYPTNVIQQVALNPGAEILLLHTRALAGSDVLVNLVQFTCYVVSIATASVVAGRLGASRRGQWYAALYAATAPIVVLEASSTQNDLVTGCWVLLFSERVLAFRAEPRPVSALEAGAALGLALVTKGTAVMFAFPFGCWLLVELWRARSARWISFGVLAALPVLVLNVPWWSRNYTVFHNPLGNIGPIVSNARHGPDVVWSNAVRNLTSEFLTPSEGLNRRLYRLSTVVLRATGVDPEDLATTEGVYHSMVESSGWSRVTHEDLAANPIHTTLALVCAAQVAWIAIRRRRDEWTGAVAFAGAVILGAVLYCLVLRWQPWATRLHVPLFLLTAPLAGRCMEQWRAHSRIVAASVMTAAALPALLLNVTRPLLPGYPPGLVSLWSRSRADVMFANNAVVRKDYEAAADLIARRHPDEVGMLLQPGTFEYAVWSLLRERGVSPRMTHLNDVVGIPHPVRPPAPDMIIAIDLEPSTSADLVRVRRDLGCDFDEAGRWGTVVVLERACGSKTAKGH